MELPLATPQLNWSPWAKRLGYIALWTLPGLAALSYYYLNQIVTAQPMAWTYGLVSTLPNWYIWAFMTPGILWLGRRFPLERSTWRTNLLAVHLPVMVLAMLVHSLVNLLLFRATGLHDTVNATLYGVHFTSRMHANIVTYWTILGLFLAYVNYMKYRAREQQAALLQIQLAQANLRALKMQLNPHFLFNTLNSVAALVRKNENRTAVKMLVQLSDFLRLALENKGVQEIPLRQELDFLRRYLDIERIRFKERLTVDIDADSSLLEAYVPNMILQPIVENAIHHGIAPHADAGCIEIGVQLRDQHLHLHVRDDGPGLPDPTPKRKGVGLTNTRERLENLYGDDQHLAMRNDERGGLRVDISLPFRIQPVLSASESV